MSPSAVGLILISAAIHVGWNLSTKASGNPKVFSALRGLVVLSVAIVFLGLFGIGEIPSDVLLIALISGIINGVYMYTLSSAYETGDLSLIYPIVRASPAFVPIAAFLFLGESMSVRGILGVAIVVAGILALHWRQFSSMCHLGFRFPTVSPGTLWSLLTLGLVVTYSLVDKEAMTRFQESGALSAHLRGPVFFLMIGSISAVTNCSILAATRVRGFKEVLRREWRRILLAAGGMFVSYSLILQVMQTEKVGYIVTLRQSSILMATLLGWLVLKERHGLFRVCVAVIMILGFILVIFAE